LKIVVFVDPFSCMRSFFHVVDLKEYNMEQFFNETAENEDMSHSWQIYFLSLGIRALQLQKKYCGKNKIRFMFYEVQETYVWRIGESG